MVNGISSTSFNELVSSPQKFSTDGSKAHATKTGTKGDSVELHSKKKTMSPLAKIIVAGLIILGGAAAVNKFGLLGKLSSKFEGNKVAKFIDDKVLKYVDDLGSKVNDYAKKGIDFVKGLFNRKAVTETTALTTEAASEAV